MRYRSLTVKTATVRELRNQFGKLSKWLDRGETVQIGKLKLPKDWAGWFADADRASLPVPGEKGVRTVAPGG